MKNIGSERFFAELAKAYSENEGAALQAGFAQISAENRLLPTAGLDKKIKSSLRNRKLRDYSLRSLPLAASLIIAVLIYSNVRLVPQSPPASAPLVAPPTVAVTPAPEPEPPMPLPEPTAEADIAGALRQSVALVSASLPAGYGVTGVDYDNAAAVMEITNAQNNRIVLVTEAYHDFDTEGLSMVKVNGSPAYGLVKSDYCVLKYQKDDMLYTLTSMFNFGDLIEIIENI